METGKKYDDDKPKLAEFYTDMKETIEAFVGVAQYGADKYDENRETPNWSVLSDAVPRIKNSMMRHVHKYLCGETIDRESGHPHLAHLIWNAGMLLKLEKPNNTIKIGLWQKPHIHRLQ